MRSLFLKIFLWFWMAMALVVSVFVVVVTYTHENPLINPNNQREPERVVGPNPSFGRGPNFGFGQGPRRWRESSIDALALCVQSGVQIWKSGGQNAFADYSKSLEERARFRAFLVTDEGKILTQSAPPRDDENTLKNVKAEELKHLSQRAAHSTKLEMLPGDGVLLAAQKVTAPDGKNYIIAGALRGFTFRPPGAANTPSTAPGAATARDGRNDARSRDGRDGRDGRDRRPGPPSPYRFWLWWLFADSQTQVFRFLVVMMLTGVVCYGMVRHITKPILQLRSAAQRLAEGDLSTRVEPKLTRRRDELGLLGREFDKMAARLESLMAAQHRLLADISHELRSPLARVSVALALVRETAGPEAAPDLDRIELETGRLNAMIGELLTLSRIESGEQAADKERVNLSNLIEDIAADADFEARSRNRAVKVLATAQCALSGTESLLRSAVENVVRNAVRYTKEGTPVEIRLSRERDESQECAVIRVRDHGSGVPEEKLADLFRPFYRIADARDRQSGGTGLGLAITQRAVKLHGGHVEARNAPDGGLQIEIRLPVTA
jgi:signal transduction histidine kinase